MLWKIESPALPGTSYLFGTMHVRDSGVVAAAAPAFERIKLCKTFASEFDLRELAEGPVGTPLRMPPGLRLADLLGPKKYTKLRGLFLKFAQFDLQHVQHLPPMLIVNLIAERTLGNELPQSLDEQLWAYAQEEGLEMKGIETFEEQLAVMARIPLPMQVGMLLESVRNISRYRSHLGHLAELYKLGDATRLYQSVKKSLRGLRKPMLYRRNEIMAQRMLVLVKEQPTFVAIGAAHLPGGKGVVRLLKQAGLKLSPVEG